MTLELGLQRPCTDTARSSWPPQRTLKKSTGLTRLNLNNQNRCKQIYRRTLCSATETKSPPVLEQLQTDAEKEQWTDGLQQLQDLGMDDTLAEKSLKRGFGWASQAYWWKEKVKEVPKPGEIKQKLDHLRDLGLSDEQLKEVVTQFPETIGLDFEKRLKPNIELMGKKFFIKGKMLPKTLARKPQALGFAVDCEGDCQGDCTRCWSHF